MDLFYAGALAVTFFAFGVAFGVHLEAWWRSDDTDDQD